MSFGNKIYIITGKGIESTKVQAQDWVNSAVEDTINVGETPSTPIHLFSNNAGTDFGVTVGEQLETGPCAGAGVCSGYSTTQYEESKGFTIPHFMIRCGHLTYFGPNVYDFALSSDDGEQYSYVCDENDYTIRPKLQLIGFFADGDCKSLENMTYDEMYCDYAENPSLFVSPSVAPIKESASYTPSSFPSIILSSPTSVTPSSAVNESPSSVFSTLDSAFFGITSVYGNYFDVIGVNSNLKVAGLNIHALDFDGSGLRNVKVYTKPLSYNGFTMMQSKWTLVQEQSNIVLEGFYRYTNLEMFEVPVVVPSRSRQAFLVISTQRQLFTRQFWPRGLTFQYDTNIRIYTGPIARSSTPFEKAGGSYAFNGSVKYTVI